MKRPEIISILTLILGFAPAFGPTAGADLLVMKDGTRVETRGPWEVKGRLLVFTHTDGKLASIRASEVDLEASRDATAEAEEAAKTPPREPPPERSREAIVVLTDADFTQVTQPAEGDTGDLSADSTDQAVAAGVGLAGSVDVASWQDLSGPDSDGVEIFGTVDNPRAEIASQVVIEVRLLDENGDLIATQRAAMSSPSIRPQSRENFRVLFPGTYSYDAVQFDVSSRPLTITPSPEDAPPSPTEDDGDDLDASG